MRHALLVSLLLACLTAPGFAASSSALPYDVMLSAPLTSTSSTVQVKSGSTFGGVPVTGSITGTTSSGTLSLFAGGKSFVSGTYSCNGGCTFSGTVAGKTVTGMTLGTSSHLSSVGTATSSAFTNHGAWVSAVSSWANANLSAGQKGKVVSGAARIEGSLASGKADPSRGSGAQDHVTGNGGDRGGEHGGGAEHGR